MYIFLLKIPDSIEYDDCMGMLPPCTCCCSRPQIKYADFKGILSPQRMTKVNRLKNPKSKCISIFSELMVKYIIKNAFDIDYDKIQFEFNEFGKPHVRNINDFYYNVSHSGEYIICAADRQMIGADIEMIRNINISVAEKFFCRPEYDYINKKRNSTAQAFLDIWTLKESIVKAEGKGLSMPLNSFSVVDSGYNIKSVYNDGKHEYFLKQYNDVLNGYKIAVCSVSGMEAKITGLNYLELLNM